MRSAPRGGRSASPAGRKRGSAQKLRRFRHLLHRTAALLLSVPLLLGLALGTALFFDRVTWETESKLYPRRYMALVEMASEKWEVPESVIYAVMRIESGFQEEAVSHADAIGLMQITRDTYDWIYFLRGEEADPATIAIPSYNIDAGTALLAWLYDRYGRWDTVYAAYNAGYSRVNGWLKDPAVAENGILVHIPITETENYVRLVSESEEQYRLLYGGTETAE